MRLLVIVIRITPRCKGHNAVPGKNGKSKNLQHQLQIGYTPILLLYILRKFSSRNFCRFFCTILPLENY